MAASKLSAGIERAETEAIVRSIRNENAIDLRVIKGSYEIKLKGLHDVIDGAASAHENDLQAAVSKHEGDCYKLLNELYKAKYDFHSEVCALWAHQDIAKEQYQHDIDLAQRELQDTKRKHAIDISVLKAEVAKAKSRSHMLAETIRTGLSKARDLDRNAENNDAQDMEGLEALDSAVHDAVMSYLFGDDDNNNGQGESGGLVGEEGADIHQVIDGFEALCKPCPKLLHRN